MTKTTPLLLLTILGFAAWWLIPFGTHGLFDDGVFYGCLSRNWAFSEDPNWWNLVLTYGLDPKFNGHPPLAIWLEGGLFMLLGDQFWIEHAYGLLMAIITAIALAQNWKKLTINYHSEAYNKESAYLPLIMWLSIPLLGWSYKNNMLENTLLPLTLWAVYCFIPTPSKRNPMLLLIGILLLFLATLTKGPVGLFPLSVFGIHWLVFKQEKFGLVVAKTIITISALIAAYCLLVYLSPNAKTFMLRYLDIQLYQSLTGQNEIGSRWILLEKISTEPLIALAIVVSAWAWCSYKKISHSPIFLKGFYFWGLIAASAVLPMLISPKQMQYYVIPSLHFISLALAVLLLPFEKAYTTLLQRLFWFPYLLTIGILASIATMIFTWGQIGRNEKMLTDVFQIIEAVPANDTMGIKGDIFKEWNLHGYLYRYGRVNLYTVPKDYDNWLVLKNETFTDTINYSLEELNLYHWYRKK